MFRGFGVTVQPPLWTWVAGDNTTQVNNIVIIRARKEVEPYSTVFKACSGRKSLPSTPPFIQCYYRPIPSYTIDLLSLHQHNIQDPRPCIEMCGGTRVGFSSLAWPVRHQSWTLSGSEMTIDGAFDGERRVYWPRTRRIIDIQSAVAEAEDC
ncbi:hypothetical protein L1887_55575 [Cichorium endivia]|nr:hypothetical protein L1887_55575 [Cichorium endivia]